ncbi:uncharacterized protein LOC135206031 [Macrobrachium nipponense]|uniref:uncharacterized protein LOC135206031 n=1 Tax=Macrobrachium nipponense TaxID=159736 RepID=UPI0030C82F7E
MFWLLFVGFWIYQPCFSFDEGVGEQEVGVIGHSSRAYVREARNISEMKLVSRESYLSSTDGKGPDFHEEVLPSKTIIQENFSAITSSSSIENSELYPYLIGKNYTITTDLGSFETDRSNYSIVKYKAGTNHVSFLSWQAPHSKLSVMPEVFKSEEYTDHTVNIAVRKVKDADTMLAKSILAFPTTAEQTHPVRMENMDPVVKGKLSDMLEYDNPSHLSLTSNSVNNIYTAFTSTLTASVNQRIATNVGSVSHFDVDPNLSFNSILEEQLFKTHFSEAKILSIFPTKTLEKLSTVAVSPSLPAVTFPSTMSLQKSSKVTYSFSTELFPSTQSATKSSQTLVKGFYTREGYLGYLKSFAGKLLDLFEKTSQKEMTSKHMQSFSNSGTLKVSDYTVSKTLLAEQVVEMSTLPFSSSPGSEFDKESHNSSKFFLHPGERQLSTSDELPNGVLEYVSSVLGISLETEGTLKVATSKSPSITSATTFIRPQTFSGRGTTLANKSESLSGCLDEMYELKESQTVLLDKLSDHLANQTITENLQRNTLMLLIIGGVVIQIQLILGLVMIWWCLHGKVRRFLNNDSLVVYDGLSKVVNFRNSVKLTEENAGPSVVSKDERKIKFSANSQVPKHITTAL